MVDWLRKMDYPLFVSYTRIRKFKKYYKATCDWAIDSGAFTQIGTHGRWTITPQEYASFVKRAIEEFGRVDFASQQDWMCEPHMIKKTGLSVKEHQQKTLQNFIELRSLDNTLPIIPTLQGYELKEYYDHIQMFDDEGIDLRKEPLVGLGSVCRRQNTNEIAQLIGEFYDYGITMHGFGVKVGGLKKYAKYLKSADSMAWQYAGYKRRIKFDECTKHKLCHCCPKWAEQWRNQVLSIEGVSSV